MGKKKKCPDCGADVVWVSTYNFDCTECGMHWTNDPDERGLL